MPKSALEIRKLTPTIGAEVLGVDLNRLTADQIAAIRACWLESQVVFFRDQEMSAEQQKALGERFGPLKLNHTPRSRIPSCPEVTIILTDETSTGAVGDTWHSDGAADEAPPIGSLLYMIEVPPNGGGDTLFANMYAAYDALAPAMKAFINGLTAINDRRYALRNNTSPVYAQMEGDAAPISEHPVVRVHPETGRKGLFINRAYTTRIPQLDLVTSDAVLQGLFNHLESPVFQCRFKWRAGSVAFWDNRCTQHYAIWDYAPQRRLGHRITLGGEVPRAG